MATCKIYFQFQTYIHKGWLPVLSHYSVPQSPGMAVYIFLLFSSTVARNFGAFRNTGRMQNLLPLSSYIMNFEIKLDSKQSTKIVNSFYACPRYQSRQPWNQW